MKTSRREPAMLEGLSRFLILHERCGAGFDVAHPAGVGSGRVSITCRGCGARHEYLTSTIEIEREVQFEVKRAEDTIPAVAASGAAESLAAAPVEQAEAEVDTAPDTEEPELAASGAAPPSAPSPSAASSAPPPSAPPPSVSAAEKDKPSPPPKAPKSGPRLGGITGARAGTIALLLVAVIAVIVAVVRLSGGSDEQAPAPTTPAQTGPTPTTTSEQPTTPEPQPQPSPPAVREVTTPTYSLSIPTDWDVNSDGPALRVAPPEGDDVGLRIYSDRRPDLSLSEMARLSGRLLTNEHPGSSASPVHGTKVGGLEAATVGVDFDGGSETAFAIASGDVRYLLLVSVRSSASAEERRQMAAAVASFRPA